MIPLEEIQTLSDNDFFDAYRKGELNSFDLPAREYLERKDIIKEEMKMRIDIKDRKVNELSRLMKIVPNVEEEDNFRAHLVLYAAEGELPDFMVLQSEEEAMVVIEEFQKTGSVKVRDPYRGDIAYKEVKTVAYTVTQAMYKSKQFKEVPVYPRATQKSILRGKPKPPFPGTNVPE